MRPVVEYESVLCNQHMLSRYAICDYITKELTKHWNYGVVPVAFTQYGAIIAWPEILINDTLSLARSVRLGSRVSVLLGRHIGCLLRAETLPYILPHSLQWCMQYHAVLGRTITASKCTSTLCYWYRTNLMITPVTVTQFWRIWRINLYESPAP